MERSKRAVIVGMAIVVLAATVATGMAQTAPAAPPSAEPQSDMTDEIELTRAVIQVKRQAIVTQAMDLEPKESEAFWPLYREYRVEMVNVNDRLVKLIETYMENYEALSDGMAAKMLDEHLGIERARLQVKNKYVPRFRKILPSRKAARFFQVENKLDAIINFELAAQIPVVR